MSISMSKSILLGCASLVAFGASAPALAQAAADSPPREGEIVVTAQKREQRLIDVPLSVSVMASEELARKGIENVVDLSYGVPGMMVQDFGPGRQVIFMRGVANRVGTSPLTSIYLDDIPVTAGAAGPSSIGNLDLRTNDLVRVEVLKGPQGTLYGAGAVAGTVRFISADPELDAVKGSAELIGTATERGDPSAKLNVVANLPLAEGKVGLRVVAALEHNGGWIDRPGAGLRDVNDTDVVDVRVKGLWRVSDAFDIKGTVIVHRNRDNDGGLNFSNADGTYQLGVDDARRSPFRDNYELYNLTGIYDFGGASLTSSTSYVRHSAKYLYPFIAGPETVFDTYEALYSINQSNKSFTQELRLASGKGPLEWTVGAYYQDVRETFDSVIDQAFGGVPFPPLLDAQLDKSSAWAAFADLNYNLTDRFKLSAGARYFDERKSTVDELGVRQSDSWNKITWRVSASYELAQSVNAYVSAASGFRSGGFNQLPFEPYNPEELVTYEAGFKGMFGGGRTRLELALFRSDYSDYLRRSNSRNPITGAFETISTNVGDVTIKGVEVAFQSRIVGGLSVQFNGAYIDSKIKNLNGSGAGLGQVSDPVDYVPEWSYTLGAAYDFKWPGDNPGFVQVDYNFRDKVTLIDRSLNPLPMSSDRISLLSARIGAEIGKWKIEAFAENLLDERGSFDPWVSWNQAVRNRPRTFGIKLGVDFD